MKKFATFLMTLLMIVSLAACTGNSETAKASSPNIKSSAAEGTSMLESNANESKIGSEDIQVNGMEVVEFEGETEFDTEDARNKVLVAYFSATNTTEGVAKSIADVLGADLYEIVPKVPYTNADLNYNDNNSRSTIEMNDPSARPAISGSVENMEQYNIIFIGYPIWWGDMPMILYSFLEEYDMSGKTVIPFNTHGGSGFSNTINTIRTLEPQANVLDGLSISRNHIQDAEQEIVDWVKGLSY